MTTTGQRATHRVKVSLRCPECGCADLATTEALTASCQGHATVTVEADGTRTREFNSGGWTDIDWDSSTTVGVACRSCLWSYEGDDHLGQLTPGIKEDH